MRNVDSRERESHILNLIVESYIEESHPISSSYLCEKFNLPYSSATVRNVMFALEGKGYLSHVHTSSGRVPTKAGFKHYVEQLKTKEAPAEESSRALLRVDTDDTYEHLLGQALDILVDTSGYTSMISLWGNEDRLFMRGMRFMLEQPEFEDIHRLKNLFYALEVKINQLQGLLMEHINDELKILIGDEIGFEEISDCSLLISGLREKDISCTLAVLGPMRMNYSRAVDSLQSIRHDLEGIMRRVV